MPNNFSVFLTGKIIMNIFCKSLFVASISVALSASEKQENSILSRLQLRPFQTIAQGYSLAYCGTWASGIMLNNGLVMSLALASRRIPTEGDICRLDMGNRLLTRDLLRTVPKTVPVACISACLIALWNKNHIAIKSAF
jgi:hypothetical protein